MDKSVSKNKYLRKNIVILFLFLLFTWLVGIYFYFFNISDSKSENTFNKEKAINLYPQAVLSVQNCEQTGDRFFTLHNDPQIYISPPKYKISSTLIEFVDPISIDFSVQVYYAERNNYLSEQNSVVILLPKGSSEIIINLPQAVFTALRYDIDIIDESYEIKGIYVSKSVKIRDYSIFLKTLIISVFIFLLWIIYIKISKQDKILENIFKLIKELKQNKTLGEIIFLISINIIGTLIIHSYFISGDLQDMFIKKVYEKRIDQQTLYNNLIDFSINGEIITSTSDDPCIFIDTSDIGFFKYIKLDIKLLGNNDYITQYFYATEERGFNEADSKIKKLNNGINYIKIPVERYVGVRLDLTNIKGISFSVKYVELTNKYSPKIGELLLIIVWWGVWFLILFKEWLINNRIVQLLIRKYEWLYLKITQDKSLYLYLFFCFILYSLWSLITPFNGAPDERMRWDLLMYIKEHFTLPEGGEPSIRNGIWGFSYAYTPYLTIIIGAFFYRIAQYFTTSFYLLLYAARLPSILFSIGTVFFTYKIGRRIFSKNIVWFFVILISMWPEFAMISSYINNDAFALFTVSIIIYSWVCGIQDNWNRKSCTLLAVGVGLCFISYYNAFGFILLSAFLWIWSMFIKKERLGTLRQIISKTLYVIIIVFIIAGWWYIRNAYLYKGDFLGMKTSLLESEKYAIDKFKPSKRQTYFNQDKNIIDMLKETPWINGTSESFIAYFGYMNIRAENFVYNLYFAIILMGLTGTIGGTVKSILQKNIYKNYNIFYIFIALSIPIPIILSLYNAYSNDYQHQGRYLLPMLISLCILITNGLEKINSFFHKYTKLGNFTDIIITLIFLAHISCFYIVFVYFHPI